MKTRASNLPKLGGRRGFILLALLLILIITGSTFVLAGLNNRQSSYLQQQTELHRQMEIAKTNLLAYIANSGTFFANARGPGFFPCPATTATDPDNDGIVSDSAGTDCIVTLGRLPTYVDLGAEKFYLNNYYAGIDQQFWYAVGDRYTYSSTSTNRRSNLRTSPTVSNIISPRFSLDSNPGYVALIIAPGEALDQDRVSVNGRSSPTNYLEGGNGTSNTYYTEYSANPSQFNDQVIGITLDEYVLAVGPRVAAAMKLQLDSYYVANGNSYPDPAVIPAAFTAKMNTSGIQWLDSTNGELWSNLTTDVTYTFISANAATIYFSDCANIKFDLTYGAGIIRRGASCS